MNVDFAGAYQNAIDALEALEAAALATKRPALWMEAGLARQNLAEAAAFDAEDQI